MERINDNACKVELAGEYGVSTTFSVEDLSPYLDYVPLENLRSNSLKQRDDDGDHPTASQAQLNTLAQNTPALIQDVIC